MSVDDWLILRIREKAGEAGTGGRWGEGPEMGMERWETAQEKVTQRRSQIEGLYREKLQVCCFSRLAKKGLCLVVTGENFFPVIRE